MSDPADKSDDLIAELAKLMANNGSSPAPGAKPVPPVAPLDSAPTSQPPAAPAVRVPGMDSATPGPAAAPAGAGAAPRSPVTGSIRIPGMDQPAPVSTSAPVSKFDFGKPVAPPAIRQEPLSSLADRIARAAEAENRNAAPASASPSQPTRYGSDLRPVAENKSFAEGPALVVARPAPSTTSAPTPAAPSPAAPPVAPPAPRNTAAQASPPPRSAAPQPAADDFNFDFGFAQNPPASAPAPTPKAPAAPASDPIADLIAADMDESPAEPEVASADDAESSPGPALRAAIKPQPGPTKPSIGPVPPSAARPAAPIPLKPVSAPPRSPETDRFAISPGVGLNMKPPAGQPLNPQPRAPEPPAPEAVNDESDPMSEIESLIGEAVRVELAAPGPVRVQAPEPAMTAPEYETDVEDEPADEPEIVSEDTHDAGHSEENAPPVVPPLTTQFAPRRAGLKDERSAAGAEDAILAAAAATGARVDRVEPSIADESPYRRLKVKSQRSSLRSGGIRQYVGIAVAAVLLLAVGLGLYWVLNMGRSANTVTGAAAPQLTADTTPVKEVPKAKAKSDSDVARSPVLQQMDGASQAPSTEQLVSTDESKGTDVTRNVTPTEDSTEGGLANRKVRTVTVRPDGTIVSGDDAVAGTEELPVDRPNVPSVPSAETTTSLLDNDSTVTGTSPSVSPLDASGLSALTPTTTADADTTALADASPVVNPSLVAPTPLSFPVRSTAAASTSTPTNSVNAVVTGAQTPNGQIDLLGGGSTDVAETTPTASADASTATSFVQIASSPSEADANAQVRSVTAKYGSLFHGNKLVVQAADLGAKGTWYRVRLPTASFSEATSICAEIKANGGDCFPTNG